MYYNIDKRYRLCGWDRLPFAVVDRKTACAYFVRKEEMEALLLCDGKTDLSSSMIPDSTRSLIEKFEKRGVIRQCEAGEELLPEQKYRLYPNRFMRMVYWSITGRCNSRCRHCYMSAPDAKYGEMTHEEVMKVIKEMGQCGVLRCSITGGEALVRKDFWEIIDGLLAEEIRIPVIYSNGFLVNEEFLAGLKQRGIRPEINMSFDGPGSHDWLRGIDGAEKAVRRAFELCRDEGFPTGAEMCLWKDNAHKLADTIRYLDSVGCESFKVNPIAPSGAWKAGGYSAKYQMSDEEVMETYLDYLEDFYRELPRMEIQLGHLFFADGLRPDEYYIACFHHYKSPLRASMCVHARNAMYISAEGRAMLCMSLSSLDDKFQSRFPLVQEEGFVKCLSDSAYMKLLDIRAGEVLAHNEKCQDCSYREFCLGGCRARALGYHEGDLLSVDEITCRSFREGWIFKVFEKVEKLRPTARCSAKELLKYPHEDSEIRHD